MARALGVDASSVSNWELGTRVVPRARLQDYARVVKDPSLLDLAPTAGRRTNPALARHHIEPPSVFTHGEFLAWWGEQFRPLAVLGLDQVRINDLHSALCGWVVDHFKLHGLDIASMDANQVIQVARGYMRAFRGDEEQTQESSPVAA
jgi:transcriptional regulator with XRE-family HTH domain